MPYAHAHARSRPVPVLDLGERPARRPLHLGRVVPQRRREGVARARALDEDEALWRKLSEVPLQSSENLSWRVILRPTDLISFLRDVTALEKDEAIREAELAVMLDVFAKSVNPIPTSSSTPFPAAFKPNTGAGALPASSSPSTAICQRVTGLSSYAFSRFNAFAARPEI